MNTHNSYFSISMSKKRERLMALVVMRAKKMRSEEPSMLENGDKKDSENANGSAKREKVNARTYKKMFQLAGQKVKASQESEHIAVTDASNEVDKTSVEKCCPGSKDKRPRVADSKGVCFGNPESANDPSRISLTDGGECEPMLKMQEFECKFSTLEFEEYWIPVHLSTMQVEQYCSLLNYNLETLSCLRNDSSLHDIIVQTRKCCDHPYLVDPTLRNTSKRDLIDPLSAEINVSGKLQLLDKLLLEIKRCGFRALVLFQSVVSSERISIGDILDDLVDRRFGEDSYVRIEGKILSRSMRAKRKEALNMFNSLESRKFVCLQDYRTCHSSILLSRVDVVIMFNSDGNPSNDLKSLQKITFDSHCKRLKVFRLYSSFTIEEKALILAKQGKTLDSNIDHINWHTCHQLLAWGASYLFTKLQSFIDSKASSSESDTSFKQSFIDDMVQEFLFLLTNKSGNSDPLNYSVISNAQLHDGAYSRNILLLGEAKAHAKESWAVEDYLIEDGPIVFWTNLLKKSDHNHTQKSSSGRLSRRLHKPSRNPYYWFEECEAENENILETFNTVVSKATTLPSSVNTKLKRNRKIHARVKQRKGSGTPGGFGGQQSSEVNHTSDGVCIRRVPENSPSTSRGTDGVSSRENVTTIEHQNGYPQITREMLDGNVGCSTQSQFGLGQSMSPTQDQGEIQRESHSFNLNERSIRSLPQPSVQLLGVPSTCISDSIDMNSITNSVCECQNNQPPVMPLVSESSRATPFETELERIQNDREQATKLHQEQKSMFLSECEKEISEIRKKYDALIEESETCLSKKLEVLEGYYKCVDANKLLAELVSSWNCYDTLDAAHPERTQKGTSSPRILQIPASALVPPANPCLTSISTSPHDLGRTVLRAPAPHLRSSPSLFAPFCNMRTACEPSSLLQWPRLPTLSAPPDTAPYNIEQWDSSNKFQRDSRAPYMA